MDNRVTVISTSGCGKCRLLKAWLDMKEIPYDERNISYDSEAVEILRQQGLRSLPQVMVDNEIKAFTEYEDILTYLQ